MERVLGPMPASMIRETKYADSVDVIFTIVTYFLSVCAFASNDSTDNRVCFLPTVLMHLVG